MSVAATGVVATMSPAGAGANGDGEKNCKISSMKEAESAPAADQTTSELPRLISFPSHCATLEVTKVVTGTPPPGTEFSVGVDCAPVKDEVDGADQTTSADTASQDQLPPGNKPPFTTTLTFPANGGTQNVLVWAKHPSECTVSETPPAGCTLTSIDPVKTAIQKAVVYPVTVTNDCTRPSQPTPAATAAVAVVQVPRFTG